SCARMDPLLRTLLQVRVVSTPQTHQHVSRAMGQAEIQAAATPYQTGTTLAGAHRAPAADAACSLAARAARWLANGTSVSREAHAQSYRSRRVRPPPPT